ncbi:MAG TPA: hypothetical protein ENO16_07665 [Chromatiales bacterium]|nr:hypothetical protein [Chromatiales bacterium]
MQSIIKNKFVLLGAAGVAVALVIGGKMVLDSKATERLADVLEDQKVESTVTYKSVSAGWLGNSVTLKDVVIHADEGEETVMNISSMTLSGIRESESSDVPSALRIQIRGMVMPIVATEGDAPKLVREEMAGLAGLGYTQLVGDAELSYDYRSEEHQLEVGLAFDLNDLGEAHARVAIDKVDLAALEQLSQSVTAAGVKRDPTELMLRLVMNSLASASKTKLAGLDFSMKDAGVRERWLMVQREKNQFTGSTSDFAKSIGDELRKAGRREAKGSKGDRVLAFYDEWANFIEDGGSLKGATDIERPVAIFNERGFAPAFTGLQAFLTATSFELKH